MLIATCHSVIPDGAPGVAPEWVHLVPAGTFMGRDGRGPYRLADPQAVITASMAEGNLPVDENHATDVAGPAGLPSPARGWIVEMQMRPADAQGRFAGLWGRVEWMPSGKQMMAERAYRGISPVFTHDDAGTVTRVLRAGLTNTPNLGDLATLHTQGTPMDPTKIRAALGLPATADEAAVLAAITANAAAGAAAVTHAADLAAIATAAGVAEPVPGKIVTALQAMRATMVPTEQVIALQAQLTTLQNAMGRDKAVAFVDGAIKAGKPIVAVRDQIIAMHLANPASAEALVNGMVSINAGGIDPARHAMGDDADGLTDMDMQTCKRMGLDPAAYAKHKKAMAKQRMADKANYDGGQA